MLQERKFFEFFFFCCLRESQATKEKATKEKATKEKATKEKTILIVVNFPKTSRTL